MTAMGLTATLKIFPKGYTGAMILAVNHSVVGYNPRAQMPIDIPAVNLS